MQFLGALFLAGTALAASVLPRGDGASLDPRSCLVQGSKEVSDIEYKFAQLIGNFSNATAEEFLTPDFTDTSDSINVLIGKPLGSVTFTSKQNFIDMQQNVPLIPLNIISTNAVTCNTIVIRWILEFEAPKLPVQGISILVLQYDQGCWYLQKVYAEFNSLTYFENAFGTCTATNTTGPSKRSIRAGLY